jgi:hypothetical protein
MIPVIDLGPHLAARPPASAATAAELGRALQDVGFFVIVNHGIPQTLIDDTFAEARRFHRVSATSAPIPTCQADGHGGDSGMESSSVPQDDRRRLWVEHLAPG